MFTLFYTFPDINDVKKRIHVLAKHQISSLRIHLCASERSERAIFGVFNSFTVKKVSFFTINVNFKVILSSNSGGDVYTGHPPHPKKWGGYIPPIPPRDLRQCFLYFPCTYISLQCTIIQNKIYSCFIFLNFPCTYISLQCTRIQNKIYSCFYLLIFPMYLYQLTMYKNSEQDIFMFLSSYISHVPISAYNVQEFRTKFIHVFIFLYFPCTYISLQCTSVAKFAARYVTSFLSVKTY